MPLLTAGTLAKFFVEHLPGGHERMKFFGADLEIPERAAHRIGAGGVAQLVIIQFFRRENFRQFRQPQPLLLALALRVVLLVIQPFHLPVRALDGRTRVVAFVTG